MTPSPRRPVPGDTLSALVKEIETYLDIVEKYIDVDGHIAWTPSVETVLQSFSTTVSTQYGVRFPDVAVVLRCDGIDSTVPLITGETKYSKAPASQGRLDPSGVKGLQVAAARGLRQQIYYSLAAHDRCDTQFGFVAVNQRFTRLVILGPDRLAIEVSDPAVLETDRRMETLDVGVLCGRPASLALYDRFPWDLFNYTIPPGPKPSINHIRSTMTLNSVSLEAYWALVRAALARLANVTLERVLDGSGPIGSPQQSSHTEPSSARFPAPLPADDQDDSLASCPRPGLEIDFDDALARRALANAIRPELRSLETLRTEAVAAREAVRWILSRLKALVSSDERVSEYDDDPDTSMESEPVLAKPSVKRTRQSEKQDDDESGQAKRQKDTGTESHERHDDRTDRDDDDLVGRHHQPANPVGSLAAGSSSPGTSHPLPTTLSPSRSRLDPPSVVQHLDIRDTNRDADVQEPGILDPQYPATSTIAVPDKDGSPDPCTTPPESNAKHVPRTPEPNARHVPPAIDAASAAKLDCASPALPSATMSTHSGKSQRSTTAAETVSSDVLSTTLVGSSPSTELHKVMVTMPSVLPQPQPQPGSTTTAISAPAAAEDPFPDEKFHWHWYDDDDPDPSEVSSAREHFILCELRKRNPVIELWSTAKLDAYLKAIPPPAHTPGPTVA